MRGRRAGGGQAAALATALATALACALLAGCEGSSIGAPSPQADSAEDVVQDGVNRLVVAGAAQFTTRIELGDLELDKKGAFTVQPQSQRTVYSVDTGTQQLDAVVLGVDGSVYVSLPDADREPTSCFMTGDVDTLAAESGVDVSTADAGLPGAALVAASAQGEAFVGDDRDEINGTVDFGTLLGQIGTKLVARLGLSVGQHRVDATLRFTDGVLTGYTVNGPALNVAADAADVPGGSAAFPDDAVIESAFTDLGATANVVAPTPDKLVKVAPGKSLDRARRRCSGP